LKFSKRARAFSSLILRLYRTNPGEAVVEFFQPSGRLPLHSGRLPLQSGNLPVTSVNETLGGCPSQKALAISLGGIAPSLELLDEGGIVPKCQKIQEFGRKIRLFLEVSE
jgi:hypothetical protein